MSGTGLGARDSKVHKLLSEALTRKDKKSNIKEETINFCYLNFTVLMGS